MSQTTKANLKTCPMRATSLKTAVERLAVAWDQFDGDMMFMIWRGENSPGENMRITVEAPDGNAA